ncbi:WecB/TagA/CpsF family glycosyltransferase [Alteromonas facilis]|uniref:WecB/TagA/CpsF family glycosyltransferase n=1 Tax=Alteromonas facilis TaxID=2048004 RepID=UPI000C2908E9|nr:WecB/TagA/CpsF family glycosyltransferase [Alteromonas facilis]
MSLPFYKCRGQDISTNRMLDIVIASLWVALISPIVLMNVTVAWLENAAPFKRLHQKDVLGRHIVLHRFSRGLLKKHAIAFDVLIGKISMCGIPLGLQPQLKNLSSAVYLHSVKPGLISLYQVHRYSGFSDSSLPQLIEKQLHMNVFATFGLIIQYCFCRLVFKASHETAATSISLFGFQLFNGEMNEAVDLIVNDQREPHRAKTFCFVNAHSVNQSARNQALRNAINSCDAIFADGSGMRVAAQKLGKTLIDNINGTDMLPILCERAERLNKRIFLLGAKPGVAEKTAQNLQRKYPSLAISGVQNGYFKPEDTEALIERINAQETDILLVAFGSPLQENWISKYATKLQCESAIAVGGLFDFYSGNIPRAPLALRQLGLEWIWRLIQEPKTKFSRYVIGTPEFLIRTFFTKQASKGV